MARVSLIFPVAPGTPPSGARIEPFCLILEEQGHTVDALVVSGPGPAPPAGALIADEPGLANAAVAGLREAGGDVLAVVDLNCGYDPACLNAVVGPVADGAADLAVARRPGWIRRLVGLPTRPLLGTTDPTSGLIALTREAFREAEGSLSPLGSRFALELLFRVEGKRVEVPVTSMKALAPPRLEFEDLRHLKRLADDRFGNLSRLAQFCMVGASGMVVDLSCYAFFQWIVGRSVLAEMTAPVLGGSLGLAVAGALAIAVALVWNFSLNRRLTFSYARKGSLLRQFFTYALGNALGIALSFTLRLFLPSHVGYFHRHRLAAALVGIVAATGISFSMSRWVVFSRRSVDRDALRLTPKPKIALAEAAAPCATR